MLHDKNRHIQEGSNEIWDIVKQIFTEAKLDGSINKFSKTDRAWVTGEATYQSG